jgi:hypothetical protein
MLAHQASRDKTVALTVRGPPGMLCSHVAQPEILLPDYENSIVNLMASVESVWGGTPLHRPLANLDPRSLADRATVVVLVLDGFGANLLDQHAPPFLSSLWRTDITSVYPSTTAAAVTSFLSGMSPLEHGAIGWSLFFKELGKYIDFLPFRDSVDGTRQSRSGMDRILRVRNLFSRVAARGAQTHYIGPRFIVRDQFADESSRPARRYGYGGLAGMFRRLARVARAPRDRKPRYVFSYTSEPDHTVHRNGTAARATAEVVLRLDRLIERTAGHLRGSGATILVTADHGLVDTPRNYWLDEDPEVYRSLILAPFPEKRFLSFHVKAGRRQAFPEHMSRYGADFRLLSREELLERGILGPGHAHPKVDDFLGDYVALAVGDAQMHTRVHHPGRVDRSFVAHHAGLRAEEMRVPLLRIDT